MSTLNDIKKKEGFSSEAVTIEYLTRLYDMTRKWLKTWRADDKDTNITSNVESTDR